MSMIKKLNQMLTDGEITCVGLTEKYIKAAKDNADMLAYVRVTEDAAYKAAKAVDAKISAGEKIGLLEGIPMTLKDNISTNGIETGCCSKILRGYTPIYDATVWETLKGFNAVLLGKSNMDEFAMGSSCETSIYGGAKNPYDKTKVAGGSSGGAASAVGANLAVYGLGSDTGGSIRQPAAFCGCVGLKPTYGAVSRYGLIAFGSSLDQIGPITTCVEDAAIVFDAISGKDKMDSTSKGAKKTTADKLYRDISGLKVGVVKEFFDGVNGVLREKLENTVKTLETLGAEIEYFDMPVLQYALPVYYIIACAEASSNLGRYDGIRYGYRTESYNGVHEMICKTRSQGFGDEVKRRILLGTYVLSSGYYDAYYKKAQNLRGGIIKAFRDKFSSCDLILTPTTPTTAFKQGYAAQDAVETYYADIFTVPINIAGVPAISLPCGYDGDGMPIGVQLIADAYNESTLLNAAYALEQAMSCTVKAKTGVIL